MIAMISLKRRHHITPAFYLRGFTCAEQGRGLALQFPRVVGFVRDDKSAEDATTAKEIAEMFAQQWRSTNKA